MRWNRVSTKNTKISLAWWCAPVVPATWEAEAGELLEPGRRRLRWAEITPLHSRLGNNSKTLSQKKKKRSYHLHTMMIWPLLLQFGYWFFFTFFFYFVLSIFARPSSTLVNNSGKSEHPCHVAGIRHKTFSFSTFSKMLAVGLSRMAFIMLRYVPSASSLLRIFVMKNIDFYHLLFQHHFR